jgi:3-phosphoshikimate 1-carboxyvinyltransferase
MSESKLSNKELWAAPLAQKPINSTLTIPGSKSLTNRYLIIAALAQSPSKLIAPLYSRDSELMVAGLRALGVSISELENNSSAVPDLVIEPAELFGPAGIDVGNAGTVMRFLPPVAALAKGLIHFDGDPRSHERPIAPVIKALEDLGATINHDGRYRLPMTINGGGKLSGGVLEIDASASSQFISSLMMIGAKCSNGLTIVNQGEKLPSLPHIEMTIAALADFGVQVETIKINNKVSWRIEPTTFNGIEKIIEPDLSNAAPFMAAAIATEGEVIIKHWPSKTTQAGDSLREIFSEMGAKIEFVPDGLSVKGSGKIFGIDRDLHEVGELAPSIAALAALAQTPSHLRNIGHLRLHETDRLAAITREVNNLGGKVREEENSLYIEPAKLHGGIFHTYEDHRLATAGAIIGLLTPGVEVENIATTRKTIPDFPGLWNELLK